MQVEALERSRCLPRPSSRRQSRGRETNTAGKEGSSDRHSVHDAHVLAAKPRHDIGMIDSNGPERREVRIRRGAVLAAKPRFRFESPASPGYLATERPRLSPASRQRRGPRHTPRRRRRRPSTTGSICAANRLDSWPFAEPLATLSERTSPALWRIRKLRPRQTRSRTAFDLLSLSTRHDGYLSETPEKVASQPGLSISPLQPHSAGVLQLSIKEASVDGEGASAW